MNMNNENKILSLWFRFRELILYGLIGGFCAALDFGVYTMLGLWIPYLWANVISVHCGIFASFFLNRSLNFKLKDKAPLRFAVFYLVGLSGLALSEGLIWLMVSHSGWDPVLAKLLTVFVVALYQFLFNKFITFRKSNDLRAGDPIPVPDCEGTGSGADGLSSQN